MGRMGERVEEDWKGRERGGGRGYLFLLCVGVCHAPTLTLLTRS